MFPFTNKSKTSPAPTLRGHALNPHAGQAGRFKGMEALLEKHGKELVVLDYRANCRREYHESLERMVRDQFQDMAKRGKEWIAANDKRLDALEADQEKAQKFTREREDHMRERIIALEEGGGTQASSPVDRDLLEADILAVLRDSVRPNNNDRAKRLAGLFLAYIAKQGEGTSDE